jgi:phosphoribosylanthranilate isomerase
MALLVKICGITSVDDAKVSIDAGANALGFNFYPRSPRAISAERAAEIRAQLPGSVLSVGVFVNASPDEVARTVRVAGLDVAQLHGEEDPADYGAISRLWRAVRVDEGFQPERQEQQNVEALLLDGPAGALRGGAGVSFDWEVARSVTMPVIVAGGLGAENVRDAIRVAEPFGVDACSRLETAPGIKDHKKIRAFLEAIREMGALDR